jgi:DNA-binding CsgD family transcriptional regulator
VTSIQLLDARGRVRAIRGRHEEAAADFLAAGRLAAGQRNPLLYATWRSNAALSLARLGDRDRARSLAEDELELAHAFGAPRGLAVALRALGVIEGGQIGLRLLRESLDALDGSEADLERMRSLVEYGAALRRAGKRIEAGRALGDALDLARDRGAGAVERRAAEELSIAGARAGKAARRGRAALSPSERRVAQLAANGLTNREIAEELFVTRKAVEWHLSNAYAKLGIHSRKELPSALSVDA